MLFILERSISKFDLRSRQVKVTLGRVEWGKTHTFYKVGSVSQSSEDNDLIPFPSGTSNIYLQQSIGETAP